MQHGVLPHEQRKRSRFTQYERITITVPPGRQPGSRVVVQAGGKVITATVPMDAEPGDVFAVDVPLDFTKKERAKRIPRQVVTWLAEEDGPARRAVRWTGEHAEDLIIAVLKKVPVVNNVIANREAQREARAQAQGGQRRVGGSRQQRSQPKRSGVYQTSGGQQFLPRGDDAVDFDPRASVGGPNGWQERMEKSGIENLDGAGVVLHDGAAVAAGGAETGTTATCTGGGGGGSGCGEGHPPAVATAADEFGGGVFEDQSLSSPPAGSATVKANSAPMPVVISPH